MNDLYAFVLRCSNTRVEPKIKQTQAQLSSASGSLPLYRQVKRELQKIIETRRFEPGKPLPSESVLAQSLQVSIGTLRHAVDELVHEHVLVRRQG
ncbi:MAG: winged helix-turn-helix transcriptional regulator, partial [Polaromonas sp.]|nr:winged helix-turn-helix transcriptional regulator [Polaromonas sp.]